MGVGMQNTDLLSGSGNTRAKRGCPWHSKGDSNGIKEGGSSLLPSTDQGVAARGTWGRRLEFTLACIGYAVGLGNVWRFPYLCYRSGGGAFLIPYLTMLFLCGIPLLFMEFVIGQYTRLGPVHAMARICPLLKGVGIATVVISFLLCTYYNVIITWALYYFFHSFRLPLPWQSCNNTWNIPENCSSGFSKNSSYLHSASQQFFDLKVLQMTDGIEQMGSIRWELLGLLVLAWILVYLCIFKGVRSTGKVVYFTAIFPYVILIALLINNVQLPGAADGIRYFLMPQWNKLLDGQVWVNAAAQTFNSIGISFGSMISMASYNKFNNNILRDTLIVAITNSATSIFAGFVIFSAIGYMAYQHNLPVDNIATDGPGLVFVVYPEAFVTMPVAPMWAALFFFMLLCLGLDSQFAMVEVMVTSLMDGCGKLLLRFLKYKELVVLVVCFAAFLLGIPNITKGGIYVFQLMDHYTAVVSLMFLAFFEVVAVCWLYGVRNLTRDVTRMLGKPPNIFFKLCWWVFSPLLVTIILVSSIIQYTPARYGKFYTYPPWAESMGWFVSLCSIIWIPLGAIHTLYYSSGSLLQRLQVSILPVDQQPVLQKDSSTTLAVNASLQSSKEDLESVSLSKESSI
ncbi:sodium- and chloride-dependent GABA transporter ine-like [Protopterus annectens]|uniref:sodium- and chloride-dependent GABA transporter ine-like n=1 Tax=Protopterus annectens TaxID=7888 RepID=UPI001CFB4BF7|nr:sodium- and chloride-dependent GABA transporter ine-like [Protopterus annectens]